MHGFIFDDFHLDRVEEKHKTVFGEGRFAGHLSLPYRSLHKSQTETFGHHFDNRLNSSDVEIQTIVHQ